MCIGIYRYLVENSRKIFWKQMKCLIITVKALSRCVPLYLSGAEPLALCSWVSPPGSVPNSAGVAAPSVSPEASGGRSNDSWSGLPIPC